MPDLENVATVMRPLRYHLDRLSNPYVSPRGTDATAAAGAAQRVGDWVVSELGDLDAPHPIQRVNRYVCWRRLATNNLRP